MMKTYAEHSLSPEIVHRGLTADVCWPDASFRAVLGAVQEQRFPPVAIQRTV
jgi:hypothetical protein